MSGWQLITIFCSCSIKRWSLLVISSMHPEFEEEMQMCPWQSCMLGDVDS